jgi:hypothetical protein
MEGGRAQKKEEGGLEIAGENSRPRDEEKGDHGYTNQSRKSAEIEYRHGPRQRRHRHRYQGRPRLPAHREHPR